MAKPKQDYNQIALEILRDSPGERFKPSKLAGLAGCGSAAARLALVQLYGAGLVKRTSSDGDARYYVPDEAEMLAERRQREATPGFRPLRRRTDHAEALQRAKDARSEYKSIG